MKKVLLALLCLGLGLTTASAQTTKKKSQSSTAKKMELKTEKDTLSYSIGADIGLNFKRMEVELNPDAFVKGMMDAAADTKMLSEEQIKEVIMAFQQNLMAKQQEQSQRAAVENKQKGESFLSKNKLQPGVIETKSGLQYQIISLGDGPRPADTNTVRVHYHGKLVDGTTFDSSYERGEAAEFPVKGVIPGWTEALQLMPVGSKFRIFLPSGLAYGEQGAGQLIGPNETLIFDVELLAIVK